MSGTNANIQSPGMPSLPEPVIRIVPQGVQAGVHDYAMVGGIGDAQFAAIADFNPRIWLYRYKKGYNAQRAQHTGYVYDNTRGFVHPAHWKEGFAPRKHIGGGGHNARSGASIGDRPSEWPLTVEHRYDAIFNPELWFLDNTTQPHSWPIQPRVGGGPYDYGKVGLSGQSNSNTYSYPDPTKPMFCGSSRTRGAQDQYFAFAVVIDDPNDDRNVIIGPKSHVIRCSIWPKVRVGFGPCGANSDLGRKIRVDFK
jgi:hypothetical protein